MDLTTIGIALISAVAVVAGAVFGTRQAAKISANASEKNALLSAETAKDIEQIKANAQRTLERDKDHRHFRRERVEPMHAYLSLLSLLSQKVISLDHGNWQDIRNILTQLDLAASQQPTRELLLTSLPQSVREQIIILHARENGWRGELQEWFDANQRENTTVVLVPRPRWVESMNVAETMRAQVHQALEEYVYRLTE